jgi:putative spermidine/putrescine transport system ATP-binding protein
VVADDRHIRLGDNLLVAGRMPIDARQGEKVTLLIRPENIRVTVPNGGSQLNDVPGRITFVRDVGGHIELRIDCGGRELIAVATPGEWAGTAGSEIVAVHLPEQACVILPPGMTEH